MHAWATNDIIIELTILQIHGPHIYTLIMNQQFKQKKLKWIIMPDYKTIHVTAGSFVIDCKQPLILEAFLSSCVGVALYDTEKDIGGLGHFLLPDPVTINSSTDLKKYASTGLPLLLEELKALGASPSKMKAAIAGGAFTGTISQQDFNLDIGGRTAGVVRDILAQNNVPLVNSETGGFFSSRMSFNMLTWDVGVTFFNDRTDKCGLVEIDVCQGDIKEILETIQPIPQVALKVLRMINDDSGSLEDLSREVKKEQVISAQVLQFCNSAVFAGRGRIDTIGDALLIIGQSNLFKLLTTIVVKQLFSASWNGYSQVQGELYHHSIGVALLAEKLAERTGKVHPFTAYTAGLMHDIGKVALDQFVASSLPLFYRESLSLRNIGTISIEQKYFKTDHTETGKQLAQLWELPETISSVIEFHHSPENCDQNSVLVNTIALANTLLHMFKAGPELARVDMSKFDFLMTGLEMTMAEFLEIIDLIPLDILTSNPESALL